MSSDVAIRAEGLGKSYRISTSREQAVTLTEQLIGRVRHPFRRTEAREFWALRDVGFEVHRGEILGIIGRNGAGKSTLLKVLSRITPPTTGRVDVYGRIGSLLEVGTGFHPELTGRENIYLNGAILGMRTAEIDRQFDAIVDFAGVANFLETPVKRYSSGMYVRLAFAVAAHLETEILVVDEVLAVGDAEFQDKCIGQMRTAMHSGRTVLLVSHNLPVIESLASRCALVQEGRLTLHQPDEAIHRYSELRAATSAVRRELPVGLPITILGVELLSPESGRLERELAVRVTCRIDERSARFVSFGVNMSSEAGVPVAAGLAVIPHDARPGGVVSFVLRIPTGGLAAGRYTTEINTGAWITAGQYERHDMVVDAFSFEVQATPDDSLLDQRRLPGFHGHLRLHDVTASVERIEAAS